MSESNKTTINSLSHDEHEMKKYDKNSNICAASGLGLAAIGVLLFFLVNPIAGIAVAGAGVVPAGVGVYQTVKYRECRKKVEAAKKKETNTKANSVSKEINKEKENKKDQNINVNLSAGRNKNTNQNNYNTGLNDISKICISSENSFSSGVSGQYNRGQGKDTQIS